MRRTRTMLVGEVLKEFFERPYVAAKIAESKLPETWRAVVGERIADMTQELRLENHILFVKVQSGLIKQELFYQREALKEKINEEAKVRIVNSVIIK